jgi:hypothetical protein
MGIGISRACEGSIALLGEPGRGFTRRYYRRTGYFAIVLTNNKGCGFSAAQRLRPCGVIGKYHFLRRMSWWPVRAACRRMVGGPKDRLTTHLHENNVITLSPPFSEVVQRLLDGQLPIPNLFEQFGCFFVNSHAVHHALGRR